MSLMQPIQERKQLFQEVKKLLDGQKKIMEHGRLPFKKKGLMIYMLMEKD